MTPAGVGLGLVVFFVGLALIGAAMLVVVFWPPTKREKQRYRDIKFWEHKAQQRKERQAQESERVRALIERIAAAEPGTLVTLEPGDTLHELRCKGCGKLIPVAADAETLRYVLTAMDGTGPVTGPPVLICRQCHARIAQHQGRPIAYRHSDTD